MLPLLKKKKERRKEVDKGKKRGKGEQEEKGQKKKEREREEEEQKHLLSNYTKKTTERKLFQSKKKIKNDSGANEKHIIEKLYLKEKRQ